MLSWFLNPWMLLGGIAVASPILIHLLNKRRFKIVEWAAMDFLFEADKKNRRRVELENFILLALRCLAMLLIALMLARPFLPSSLTNLIQQAKKLERVIVLDDSLSQQVTDGNSTSFAVAKDSLKELVTQFSDSDKTEDWLTVMVTSDPEVPVLANQAVTPTTLAEIVQAIDELECSDSAADYSATINRVSRYVSGQREEGGRAVYLFSDMRKTDWLQPASADPEMAPNKLINSVADAIEGFFVVDTGSNQDNNLAVAGIRPEDLLVADRAIPFVVTVANFGAAPVDQVRVLFQVDDGQPDYETIPTIGPGEKKDVIFRHVFPRVNLEDSLVGQDAIESMLANYRVRAEIDRQSFDDASLASDQLLDDSVAYFASQVVDGLPVLLVDGDPSSISERSETHNLRLLQRAIRGLNIDVVTAAELETVSLSDYKVIFLCNIDEASTDRVKSLEQWVSDGGSLVFMLGDRVRARVFNEAFFKMGKGLSPVEIDSIVGDPTRGSWVNFEVDQQIHPSLSVIVDTDATSLNKEVVFTWWTSKVIEAELGKSISVPVRLTDENSSPLMLDRTIGKGTVILFTIPADGDWTDWPSRGTFAPVMMNLIDYLVGTAERDSRLKIDGEISVSVDVSAFDERVSLRDPQKEKVETVAAPLVEGADSVLYQAKFDGIKKRGFYELAMTRHNGKIENTLFAANVDANEGQLKRMGPSDLEGDFFSDKVSFLDTGKLSEQSVKGGNSEIWTFLLMALFGILMVEQFLGWFWGKRR